MATSLINSRDRLVWRIWLLALAVRVLFAVIVFACNPERLVGGGASYGGDGSYYDLLAFNLLHHGAYSLSMAPPYLPDMYRVPGYTTLLALIYAVFGRLPRMVVCVQLLLGATSCALAFKLGERLTGDRRAAALGALLLCFDLSSLVAALELWTETVFTLLLLLHLLACWEYRLQPERLALLRAGLWLGLVTLFRPEAVALAPVEAVVLLLWAEPPRRRILPGLALFLATVACVLAPWLARNWYHFRLLSLASVGGDTALFENAMLVEAAGRGLDRYALKQVYQRQLTADRYRQGLPHYQDPRTMALKRRLAMDIVAAEPLAFARMHLQAYPLVWAPHVPGLLRLLGYPTTYSSGHWQAWRQHGWQGLWQVFRERWLVLLSWPVVAVCLAWGVYLLAVYAGAARGLWLLLRSGRQRQALLLLLPIVYFAGVVQLAVLTKTPRHLVPLMPYLAIAAGVGLSWRRLS